MFRFVTGFLIPVLKASQRMRQQMHQAQGHAQSQYRANDGTEVNIQTPADGGPSRDSGNTKPSSKDYIEFEEIKH